MRRLKAVEYSKFIHIHCDCLSVFVGLLVASVCITPGTASAQTSHTLNLERQQQDRMDAQRQQQQEEQTRRQGTLKGTPAPITAPISSTVVDTNSPCFIINSIAWQTSTTDKHKRPLDRLKQQAEDFVSRQPKRCLNNNQLIDLHNSLTEWLLNQGYLTSRIGIPNQNIATGTLTLEWQPGIVSQIDTVGQAIGSTRMLMPRQIGHIYNQRDTDQALENLKRLSSQSQATIDLTPAEQQNSTILHYQLGQTRLKDRINGSIGIDNSGNTGSGRYQANASITIDSPLGLYDQLTLNVGNNANATQNRYNNRSNGIYWDVPLGYVGLQLGATRSS